MQFRLHYRGDLRSNANAKHKWQLRGKFHTQLQELWKQEPLQAISKYIDPSYLPNECYLGVTRGKHEFYSIVSEKIWTVAELDILLLRPGNPGSISVGGGDIDNRLKTLLDSLRVPDQSDDGSKSPIDSREVFCLLQDDKLITRLSVETDRLLDWDGSNSNEVVLIIRVHIRASSGRLCNVGIAS